MPLTSEDKECMVSYYKRALQWLKARSSSDWKVHDAIAKIADMGSKEGGLCIANAEAGKCTETMNGERRCGTYKGD